MKFILTFVTFYKFQIKISPKMKWFFDDDARNIVHLNYTCVQVKIFPIKLISFPTKKI